MTKTMDRVALLGKLCSSEVLMEAGERSTVTEGPVLLAIKEELLFRIPSAEPALQREECIVRNVDHPSHAVLLSLVEMHLAVPEIDIIERETEGFADPDARPQKKQNECPIPGVVDHGEEPSHILGGQRAGKSIGKLEPDRFLQGAPGDEILLDEEVEKGDDEGHPRLHRGNVHTAILLVFDEGFQVSALEILKIRLRSSVEAQEEHNGGEGTFECASLVVQTGLVDQVALELFLCGKLKGCLLYTSPSPRDS